MVVRSRVEKLTAKRQRPTYNEAMDDGGDEEILKMSTTEIQLIQMSIKSSTGSSGGEPSPPWY